jgi:NADH-quinone oxidoreductase subunit E
VSAIAKISSFSSFIQPISLKVSAPIEVPRPRVIDRSQLSYVRPYAPVKVKVPLPASIVRGSVTYLFGAKPDGAKPETIEDDLDQVKQPGAKPSVLEQNVASPITPGTVNFPPFAISPELEQKADQRIAQYPVDQRRSAVLPLLHEVQHRFGFISPASIDWVSQKLDIAPIKVVEVVTFYPGFRQKAPGKLHFRVCRTLSCAMGGSYELMAKLCELTGIDRSSADPHTDPISVSPCGNYSVEYAECLASCGTAPVCLVNDDFHEDLSPDKAQDLIAKYNG